MTKTQEELNVIKEEVEILNNKQKELIDDELNYITGGTALSLFATPKFVGDWQAGGDYEVS